MGLLTGWAGFRGARAFCGRDDGWDGSWGGESHVFFFLGFFIRVFCLVVVVGVGVEVVGLMVLWCMSRAVVLRVRVKGGYRSGSASVGDLSHPPNHLPVPYPTGYPQATPRAVWTPKPSAVVQHIFFGTDGSCASPRIRRDRLAWAQSPMP